MPRENEVVVYLDLFQTGLRFACDSFVWRVLDRFGIKMHHLSPSGVLALSTFAWAVKSYQGELTVDAFARFFGLHRQPKKVVIDDEEKVCLLGSCSFIPRGKGLIE